MATQRDPIAPDTLLKLLVSITNKLTEPVENGPGVVLTLPGLVVSGQIIPHWQWHLDVQQQIKDSATNQGQDPEGNGFAYLFGEFSKSAIELRDAERAAQDAAENLTDAYAKALADVQPIGHIHLKEARVYSAHTPGLPGNGMHWRGRLDQVAGWCFGQLGDTPDS